MAAMIGRATPVFWQQRAVGSDCHGHILRSWHKLPHSSSFAAGRFTGHQESLGLLNSFATSQQRAKSRGRSEANDMSSLARSEANGTSSLGVKRTHIVRESLKLIRTQSLSHGSRRLDGPNEFALHSPPHRLTTRYSILRRQAQEL